MACNDHVDEACESSGTPDVRHLTFMRSLSTWIIVVWGLGVVAIYLFLPAGEKLDPSVTLTGLFVGFLVGLTGMGGAALMTPILIFIFGFRPMMAIGTDITYAAVTKVFGSWRHWRQGSIDIPLVIWLSAGSIPAGLLGVAMVKSMNDRYGQPVDTVLYRAIGSALIAVGVLLIWRVIMKVDRQYRRQNITLSTRRKLATVALGAGTGIVIGLTSVGSGTFVAMFLILFYPLTPDRIVGTQVLYGTLLLTATGLAQIRLGNVDLAAVGALLLGSIPGVIVGSRLCIRAPARVLRVCLAAVLLLSGLALLYKA